MRQRFFFFSDRAFSALNPQLTILKLDRAHISDGIDAILQHLPNLTEIELNHVDIKIKCPSTFRRLQHLTSFTLRSTYGCDDVPDILWELHKGRVRLERLSLAVQVNNKKLTKVDDHESKTFQAVELQQKSLDTICERV